MPAPLDHPVRTGARGTAVLLLLPALIALSALPATDLSAQTAEGIQEVKGAGFFAIGAHRISISELNDRLVGAGLPEFGSVMFSIGGGGYALRGEHLLIGGEGYGILAGEVTGDGRPINLAGGYGLFNLGYLQPLGPGVDVYPLLGFGGGGLTLDFGAQGTSDGFDEVIADPGREASLTRGGILMSIGGGARLRLSDADGGLILGMRAGYTFEPFSVNWRMGGTTLGGGPDTPLSGLYLRFSVGAGR